MIFVFWVYDIKPNTLNIICLLIDRLYPNSMSKYDSSLPVSYSLTISPWYKFYNFRWWTSVQCSPCEYINRIWFPFHKVQ